MGLVRARHDSCNNAGRVSPRRLGQRVRDDHARSINRKRPLLPASGAASTVVHRRPCAFAHHRQSRAVDEEMEGAARWEAAACNRERLTASGERGVVGGVKIDTQHRQDRPQAACRVASAERHSVTSPRWTKACSYADQCSTRSFVVYCGWTFDRMSRSCTRSGHRGQRAYSGLVAAEGLCTNAPFHYNSRIRGQSTGIALEVLWN